jgi:indolepyruvate ferredoxin oxidoreductase alpha subunit
MHTLIPKEKFITVEKVYAYMKFMLGNQAVAAAAYAAGVRVATSYPGTPSTEILETIKSYDMLHCEWSVNEKVALEVAAGYAIAGIPSMCSMKNVGLNVASDALMTLAYTGVVAPLIISVVDTPDCFSSQNEQDTRWYGLAAKIPVFEPNSVQDSIECVFKAFDLSKELQLPVIIRLTTRIAHGGGPVEVKKKKIATPKQNFQKDSSRYVMVPKNSLKRHEVLCRKYEQARRKLHITVEGDGKKIAVATGICASAVRDIGGIKLVEIKGIPFDEPELTKKLEGASEIFVFEQGAPIIEDIVSRVSDSEVIGRRSGHIKCHGELKFHHIKSIIEGEPLKEEIKSKKRRPLMCSGCPHLATFFWLRNLDKIVVGDIGCYGLGKIDFCVCMGSSIGIGQALDNSIAVLGDSTFFHSGMSSLVNAVNQKRDLCIIVLDNSTTAMTGNQPVPQLSIEEIAKACGAETHVINPYSKESKGTIKRALGSKGVNVVVSRAPCRRDIKKGKRYEITDSCTDCELCEEINCPAIEGRKINYLCVGCGFCAEICPVGAIK